MTGKGGLNVILPGEPGGLDSMEIGIVTMTALASSVRPQVVVVTSFLENISFYKKLVIDLENDTQFF